MYGDTDPVLAHSSFIDIEKYAQKTVVETVSGSI
jgi:hypothetical protein